MASSTMSMSLTARPALAGKRVVSAKKMAVVSRPNRMSIRADGYLFSPTNLCMIGNIAGTMLMIRSKFSPIGFLIPEPQRKAFADAMTSETSSWSDPSGFTGEQILAAGALGHVHGVAMVLGLKAMGML
mmetsp:Transcript_32587/g.45212  ORF Transcript_32587/g.45212 Transcript_32587/m.45212 type:complete len:129 (-) Transcript_32587:165-551(-)|eukprot:CAMPEP_0196579062 /NCGR_PEP_ID=MMETSP1081-20130531/17132_1 /TAXON_ID=36882 /ORGANISM="Pyramimonas amylifera, Strain CCMP720" /LENGTH=128 /DNA_ID=CAMNT_0041898509 /DNA_START=66 /DNA_END=452 /DNA_ORIENTATION=-